MTVRTLGNWERQASERSAPRAPGRPPIPRAERRAVLWRVARAVRRLGLVGWRVIVAELGAVSRRVVCEILAAMRARRERRRAEHEARVRMRTDVRSVGTMWCLDATHVGRERDGTAILAEVLLDATSRKVLAGQVGAASTQRDIIALLEDVARREGGLPLVLVKDNGSAYVGRDVEVWLAERGVLHLKSLPRTPQHNAKAERTIGLVKEAGEIGGDAEPITTRCDAVEALQRGIDRLHARKRAVLGWQTSLQRHASADRWYTHARRAEVVEDARRALEDALQDTVGRRARRRAERKAILETLVKHGLITITRGATKPHAVKCEDVL